MNYQSLTNYCQAYDNDDIGVPKLKKSGQCGIGEREQGKEKGQIGAKDVIDASFNTGVQRELCKKDWFHRSEMGPY
jgi:hypothetical protein